MNWQKKSILETATLRKYLAEADPGGDVGGACPPIFCNHLIFLQSLSRTAN